MISLLPIISPSYFKNVDWAFNSTWIRFLNSYNASFLALVSGIFLILKYRFNYKIINIVTFTFSIIAIAAGQVTTVWGVFGAILIISFIVIFSQNKIFKNIKLIVLMSIVILIGVYTLIILNKDGFIDLATSLKPFTTSFDQTGTFKWREIVWYRTLQNWQLSPILGLGYGGYFPGPMGETIRAPHSSYVAVLAKQGIIGFALMISVFFILLAHFTKHYIKSKNIDKKIGGIIGILTVVSMLIFAYSYEFTLLQWVLLGLGLFLTNNRTERKFFLGNENG